jgi:hypothetical protein
LIFYLVLQQVGDIADDETVKELSFKMQWHYALNITEEHDSAKYMCPKTLWNMCSVFVDNAVHVVLVDHITNELSKVFKVNCGKQKVDSVRIKWAVLRNRRIRFGAPSIASSEHPPSVCAKPIADLWIESHLAIA